jgi:hypothetical protein
MVMPQAREEPRRFAEVAGVLRRAGYVRYFSGIDAQSIWILGQRCPCGGRLDYRGLNRLDPEDHRGFAVCERCDRIAYET